LQSVETRQFVHPNQYRPTVILYMVIKIIMLQMRYSPELFDSRVDRTVRCKITGQVDFSSRLEMTCNETDSARKF